MKFAYQDFLKELILKFAQIYLDYNYGRAATLHDPAATQSKKSLVNDFIELVRPYQGDEEFDKTIQFFKLHIAQLSFSNMEIEKSKQTGVFASLSSYLPFTSEEGGELSRYIVLMNRALESLEHYYHKCHTLLFKIPGKEQVYISSKGATLAITLLYYLINCETIKASDGKFFTMLIASLFSLFNGAQPTITIGETNIAWALLERVCEFEFQQTSVISQKNEVVSAQEYRQVLESQQQIISQDIRVLSEVSTYEMTDIKTTLQRLKETRETQAQEVSKILTMFFSPTTKTAATAEELQQRRYVSYCTELKGIVADGAHEVTKAGYVGGLLYSIVDKVYDELLDQLRGKRMAVMAAR